MKGYSSVRRDAKARGLVELYDLYHNLRVALAALELPGEQLDKIELPDEFAHLLESFQALKFVASVVRGGWDSAVPAAWLTAINWELYDTDDGWNDDEVDEPTITTGVAS